MTEFPETHTSLLAQLKSLDDRQAWEQFVALYRPVIYRIARRRGFQEADAQDVTQRVLASIANSIHRWKPHDASTRFRHWLRRVVRNAIINAATRGPRESPVSGLPDESLLLDVKVVPAWEDEIHLEYRREIFRQAAELVQHDVAPETWRAFHLTVVEGQAADAVANELGKSVGAVYAARGRVMQRIKDAVKRLEAGPDNECLGNAKP